MRKRNSTNSNEGPRHFPRGDNSEIVKIDKRKLKFLCSRITAPILNKTWRKVHLGETESSLLS